MRFLQWSQEQEETRDGKHTASECTSGLPRQDEGLVAQAVEMRSCWGGGGGGGRDSECERKTLSVPETVKQLKCKSRTNTQRTKRAKYKFFLPWASDF